LHQRKPGLILTSSSASGTGTCAVASGRTDHQLRAHEIIRKLTPDAPGWAAIVEETFPIGALTDPKVFYDAKSDADLRARMDRMLKSCQRFLAFEPMEYTHMSEYYLG
jgi:hypothetical protein